MDVRLPQKIDYSAIKKIKKTEISGKLFKGSGKPSLEKGRWPQLLGPERSNIAKGEKNLIRSIPESGLKLVWKKKLMGEGYTGPCIMNGCIYLMDYDQPNEEDVVRCMSLDDGEDIWRFSYKNKFKGQHGFSRTTCAANEKYVVAIGPKGHVLCLESMTGKLVWYKDLVGEYGSTIPQWDMGQCPLIDGDRVIIAPSGNRVLIMAVDLATGKEVWTVPNQEKWKMTHSSVNFIDFKGVRQYIYSSSGGVISVFAKDGKIAWKNTKWRVSTPNTPIPLVIDNEKLLFTGSQKAGSLMIKLTEKNGKYSYEEVFSTTYRVFGSYQQTPIYYKNHIFGIIEDNKGMMVCITKDGKFKWKSGGSKTFGYGPYIIADGLIFVLHEARGTLHIVDTNTQEYKELAKTKIVSKKRQDNETPLVILNGKLYMTDSLEDFYCFDIRKESYE
jgi:outer membrane protein assembly factor BamB